MERRIIQQTLEEMREKYPLCLENVTVDLLCILVRRVEELQAIKNHDQNRRTN